MGGGKPTTNDSDSEEDSMNPIHDATSRGDGGFVVIEKEEAAAASAAAAADDVDFDIVPDDDLNVIPVAGSMKEGGAADSTAAASVPAPGAFESIGSNLSVSASTGSVLSTPTAPADNATASPAPRTVWRNNNDNNSEVAAPTAAAATATAAAAAAGSDTASPEDPTVVTAAVATTAALGPAAPRMNVGAAAMAASEFLYEFLYAYAIVAYHEALALVEKACVLAKSARRKWDERGPPPPSVKRAMEHRFFPTVVVVLLSLLVVLPAYWAIPNDRQRRLSAREWEAKYEDLNSKHSAAAARNRLMYDSLAGRHLELQAEYEDMLENLSKQHRAARAKASHYDAKAKENPGSCSKEVVHSAVATAKDVLLMAEQSAYELFRHFSDGLRDDMHEVKGLFQRKTRSWLDSLR